MDARTAHILKHPGYFGTVNDVLKSNQYRYKPLLREITFTKVPQTEVTCTYCNGSGGMLSPMNGHLLLTKCANCNGTKKMMIDNREVKGYGL